MRYDDGCNLEDEKAGAHDARRGVVDRAELAAVEQAVELVHVDRHCIWAQVDKTLVSIEAR